MSNKCVWSEAPLDREGNIGFEYRVCRECGRTERRIVFLTSKAERWAYRAGLFSPRAKAWSSATS